MFIRHNEETIDLLPNGRGICFPTILSYQSSLDKSIVDFMRPLFDNGLGEAL